MVAAGGRRSCHPGGGTTAKLRPREPRRQGVQRDFRDIPAGIQGRPRDWGMPRSAGMLYLYPGAETPRPATGGYVGISYVEFEDEAGILRRYRKHVNGRGLVATTAKVDATAFVDPTAYVDPEALEVVEPVDHAAQVADAIAVGVLEAARVHLVHHGRLPPVGGGRRMPRLVCVRHAPILAAPSRLVTPRHASSCRFRRRSAERTARKRHLEPRPT